ncbi:hypothetical protein Q5P01_010713 [Channa striata]|uniref:Uncharacterized protein n=1 Tax=Channa striata TaxID=64152 RepID=A0AA88MT05_CHASR|nr:hypothetical protein Q5P01_010713 [Channa striata]
MQSHVCDRLYERDCVQTRYLGEDTGHIAVLNASKTRALTNNPCRLSSKWNVELGGLSSVKIAGTDKTPFHRSLTVYDEDNRQAMLNVLTFMTTEGLRASEDAKGSVTVTLLYGTSVLDVCYNMSAGVRDAEEGEELDLGAAVAQFGYDTLIRRFPLRFKQVQRDMSLKDWCAFHHGETGAAEHGSMMNDAPYVGVWGGELLFPVLGQYHKPSCAEDDFVFDNVSEGIRRSQDLKQVSRTTRLRRVGRVISSNGASPHHLSPNHSRNFFHECTMCTQWISMSVSSSPSAVSEGVRFVLLSRRSPQRPERASRSD